MLYDDPFAEFNAFMYGPPQYSRLAPPGKGALKNSPAGVRPKKMDYVERDQHMGGGQNMGGGRRQMQQGQRSAPSPQLKMQNRRATAGGNGPFAPTTDIFETSSHYHIHVELPGCTRRDITVQYRQSQLTIMGRVDPPWGLSPQQLRNRERMYGPFMRVIELPPESNTDRLEAQFDEGVLTLQVPKLPGRPMGTKRAPVDHHYIPYSRR